VKDLNIEKIILITISLIILFYLKSFFLILFSSFILVNIFENQIKILNKIYPLPRKLALAISILILIIIITTATILIAPPFIREFKAIILELPSVLSRLSIILNENIINLTYSVNERLGYDYSDQNDNLITGIKLLDNFFELPDGTTILTGITDSLGKLINIASNVGSVILQVLFILITSIIISLQPEAYKEAFILIVPIRYRNRTRRVINKSNLAITNWLICILISSFFIGLLSLIGLSILDVKYSVANAIIAVVFNLIPNIGPLISTIFPMSIAFLDSTWKAIGVLLLYILIQNLETYFITPSLMQRRTKLLPGATLIGQFILTIIFGPLGLLLSLPLLVVIQVIVKEFIIYDKSEVIDYRNES
tara:strand:- start:1568 stop:2665 length:1098 start_codon:yes stop_codon:yes gene_type:complete